MRSKPLPSWQVTLQNLAIIPAHSQAPSSQNLKPAQLHWLVQVSEHGALCSINPLISTFDSKKKLWSLPKPLHFSSIPAIPYKYFFEADDHPAWTRLARLDTQTHRQLPLLDFLEVLENHPRVFIHTASTPVPSSHTLIQRVQPRLEGVLVKDNLLILPSPPLRSKDPSLRAQEPPYPRRTKHDRACAEQLERITLNPLTGALVILSPEQLAALQALPPLLIVPHSDIDAFAQSAQQISHLFDIQLPRAHQPQNALHAELLAELTPDEDSNTFDIKVYARLPSGARAPLGAPPALVQTYINSQPQSIWRDIPQEILDAKEITSLLAIPHHSPMHWILDLNNPSHLCAALRAIHFFQNHPRIQLLWPKNCQPWKTHTANTSHLSLNVSKNKKTNWFEVSGSLALDPDNPQAAIPLSQITSYSNQFVEIAPREYVQIDAFLQSRLSLIQNSTITTPTHSSSKPDTLMLHPVLAAGVYDAISDLTDSPDTQHDPNALLSRPQCYKDPELAEQVSKMTSLDTSTSPIPPSLLATPRPYQISGFRWLASRYKARMGAVLADDMGLGKTLQTIALMLQAPGPHLVVAPASLVHNWQQEIRTFAPHLTATPLFSLKEISTLQPHPSQVVIVSYNLALSQQKALALHSWDILVMDEAQNLKNPTSKRAHAIANIPASFKLALSGTPIENNLTELWAVFHQVNPSLLGPFATYRETFLKPIESSANPQRLAQLKAIINPFILRRTKDKVLSELPPLTETVHEVLPAPDEQAILRAIQLKAQQALAGIDSSNGHALFITLQYITQLRRAACDPRLLDPSRTLPGAKVLAISELISNLKANGHRTLVFSQFTDFLHLIEQHLLSNNISCLYLDGATPPHKRKDIVDSFQTGSHDAFLISLKAGGSGLNITAADYVIIADPWWNPAVEDQATARAYRMGQSKPVTVYRIVNTAPASVEPKVLELHASKRDLANSVLDANTTDPSSFQALDSSSILKALGLQNS